MESHQSENGYLIDDRVSGTGLIVVVKFVQPWHLMTQGARVTSRMLLVNMYRFLINFG